MSVRPRPFWLPASNYYVMAVAVAGIFFFVIWGVLHDTGEEAPWVTAGISASVVLIGAVIVREIVLRRARNRFFREQRRMEARVVSAGVRGHDPRDPQKLTLERNAAILSEIKRKSDAARVLGKFSAGHKEVFDLCSRYIAHNEGELKSVNAGSPRLSALLKGRSIAAEIHHYHMLRWAEIEVTELTNDARSRTSVDEKIESASAALDVIELSLSAYPAEASLLESKALLQDLVVSIRVSDWVEQAQRAEFEGDLKQARSLLRDALYDLARDNVSSAKRDAAAKHLNAEIERLRVMENAADA